MHLHLLILNFCFMIFKSFLLCLNEIHTISNILNVSCKNQFHINVLDNTY